MTTTGRDTESSRVDEGARGTATKGLLSCSPDGARLFGLSPSDRAAVTELNRQAWRAIGITTADRVVLALNNDGDSNVALLHGAAADVAGAAASVGPRGRMRILRAIEAVGATTLVITPCGAADLLARLHIEFLIDPQELGLRRLIVLGEIVPPESYGHLAREFAVDVHELWCDPCSGAVLAHREARADASFHAVAPGLIAPVSVEPATPSGVRWVEWTVSGVAGTHQSPTGWVAPATVDGMLAPPDHTIGDRLLVRGRWLSISALDKSLKRIDGIVGWTLEIDRPGTLDKATLHVVLNRPTLVDNPMWAARIRNAVEGVSPISIEVVCHAIDQYVPVARIDDRRGHHLGGRASCS